MGGKVVVVVAVVASVVAEEAVAAAVAAAEVVATVTAEVAAAAEVVAVASAPQKKKIALMGGSESAGEIRCAPDTPVYSGRGELVVHPGRNGPPYPAQPCSLQELISVWGVMGILQL